jgi:hypothetical protein
MNSLDVRPIVRRVLPAIAAACALLAILIAAAPASAAAPWWRVDSSSAPTNLKPGDKADKVIVSASNVGDATVSGASKGITVTDVLPPGLKATSILGQRGAGGGAGGVVCTPVTTTPLSCTYKGTLVPFELLEVQITVEVEAGASSGGQNQARVEGGEGPGSGEPQPATLSRPLTISSAPTPFGIQRAELAPEREGGAPDMQAGEHPFQLTTTLHFNEVIEFNEHRKEQARSLPALPKDLQFRLPPGMIGNPTAVPQCSDVDFTAVHLTTNACGDDTVVGVAMVTLNEPISFGAVTRAVPVFNLAPAPGEPARFGFFVLHDIVVLDTSVRTGEDYGVDVSVNNASQVAQVLSSQVTLWGEPGEPSHDASRGWTCVENGLNVEGSGLHCESPTTRNLAPFLTLPTSCTGPLTTTAFADSWLEPGTRLPDGRIDESDPRWARAQSSTPGLEGCGLLPFSPSIAVEPDTQAASTPAGFKVTVNVPQETTLAPKQLAEATVRSTTVALPVGMELNPGAADGLLTCSAGELGFLGANEDEQTSNNKFSPAAPECPDAAKVGTVKITTPLLPNKLEGSAYLAQQNTNPFAPPLVLYLVARDPVSGVLVKLAGHVTPDPNNGQLVSVFEGTPPLPFEHLEVSFFSGPRASVSTPPLCGTYTTTTSITPWSGEAPASPAAEFPITSGPGGSPCSNPQPFSPGFQAGSQNIRAAAFTSFSVNLARPDADQALSTATVHLPPGAAAMLSSVTPCPEPQASLGTCGPESLIGHTTAIAGLGSDPISLGGQVYITGPYKGAPFGLTIVTAAVAGPFNLGNVIVRSQINVDPNTAAVTVTSDPLPLRLKGVPSQLQRVNVTVDRPGFQFNPTNCSPKAVGATLTGAQGATANVSSPFQVTGCGSLPFAPKLTATAGGQASKANGASLNVNVTSPGFGQDSIAKVFLTLPKALPSRLTTIQKACVDTIFNQNPAACNEGSVIGRATIHTPVLKNPLTGPAYLVAHGNAAFPDVEFVLQGEGITLVLDGKTDIKKGITYSRFESTPDAPFTTFETQLPVGPHSALTANVPEKEHYSLCKTKLTIPTEITAQNGAVIKQETKVGLTGCTLGHKSQKLSRAQKLKRALKHCRKEFKHNKKKRGKCEATARKKYGPKKHSRHKRKK